MSRRGAAKVFTAGKPKGKTGYHLGAVDKQIPPSAKPEDAVPHNGGRTYAEIMKECKQMNQPYEDEDFPAIDASLFTSKKPPRPFVWKRPTDITDNPSLFVEGASRFDISQGMLGDCWLLAALAALCQHESLLHQVVPPDQNFDDNYGIIRFRFWQYGRWEEVIIDDRLPTYNNKLVFVHSAQGNEFWSALLEKAYAKICGNYEALKGGQTSEAMEDFTGGVTETHSTAKLPPRFFKLLMNAEERQSLMCCSIEAKPNEIEAKLDNGLIKGHAYTITGIKKVETGRGEKYQLIRVRNPWGNEKEWTGAWSDGSKEWSLLSDDKKKEIGLSYDNDGEFWMSYDDFIANFTKVEVCLLSPDSAGASDKKCWAAEINQGSWQKNVSAGGCRNFPETFHQNPQYRITLEDPDDDDEVDNCTIVLGLMQKGRRKQKHVGAQNLTIGFSIYLMGDDHVQYIENDRLSKDFFLYHKSTARSENFVNGREVCGRFCLPPGQYVILPSTFKNNEEGDFIFRMFSEKAHESSTMDTSTTITIKPCKVETDDECSALDKQLKPFFIRVAGEDGEIDSFELQTVLRSVMTDTEGRKREVSLEASRSMLAMVDRDRNGKLDYSEFKDLWKIILPYKEQFNKQDDDKSGDFSMNELRQALAALDMKISTPVLSSIVLRYANKHGNVNFDDFLQIACRVRGSFEAYLNFQGKSFSLDDYIMSSIYT